MGVIASRQNDHQHLAKEASPNGHRRLAAGVTEAHERSPAQIQWTPVNGNPIDLLVLMMDTVHAAAAEATVLAVPRAVDARLVAAAATTICCVVQYYLTMLESWARDDQDAKTILKTFRLVKHMAPQS